MLIDIHGELLCAFHLNMPHHLRSTLLDRYRSSLPGHLKHVDTANDEGPDKSAAEAVHFDWYNRYSTLVSLFYLFSRMLQQLFAG